MNRSSLFDKLSVDWWATTQVLKVCYSSSDTTGDSKATEEFEKLNSHKLKEEKIALQYSLLTRKCLDDKDEELAEERKKVEKLEKQITGLNNDIRNKSSQIENLERECDTMRAEIAQLKANSLLREAPLQSGVEVSSD